MNTKKILFETVFEKAKNECGKKSKNGISIYLENYINENHKPFSISSKSISRYYDEVESDVIDQKNISIDLLNCFAQYIGYDNYVSFKKTTSRIINIDHNSTPIATINNSSTTILSSFKNKSISKYLATGGIITTIIGGSLFYKNQSDKNFPCMVWTKDHYKGIECDDNNDFSNVIPFSEDVSRLRKITRSDTLNYENALNKVWYLKNNGEIELYTNYGLHPENGKTLKPITKYILKKYIIKTNE